MEQIDSKPFNEFLDAIVFHQCVRGHRINQADALAVLTGMLSLKQEQRTKLAAMLLNGVKP